MVDFFEMVLNWTSAMGIMIVLTSLVMVFLGLVGWIILSVRPD